MDAHIALDRRPGSVASIVGIVGEVLLAAGLIILLFVTFEIFGTAYLAGNYQRSLTNSLAPTIHTSTRPVVNHAPPRVAPPSHAPIPTNGTPIAILSIPALDLTTVVVQGTNTLSLERGPGHYRHTPMPGEAGNVAIAGHRTTWGRPFYNLDQVPIGSLMTLSSPQGVFTYRLKRLFVVNPKHVKVLRPTLRPSLTLTTCNPRFSASTRLVARAVLVGSSLTPAPQVSWPRSAAPSAPPNVMFAWILGVLSTIIVSATLVLMHLIRRTWLVLVIGVPASMIVVIGFFAAVTPFLPANL